MEFREKKYRQRSAQVIEHRQCTLCSMRGSGAAIYKCFKHECECTTRQYARAGSDERKCIECEDFDECIKPITFAYPYIASSKPELRYSLRSVAKFATVPHHILLCGDPPDWYRGDSIQVERLITGDAFDCWRDVCRKLKLICQDPRTSDDFVYMHDDYYWLRPFDLSDIRKNRNNGPYQMKGFPANSGNWIKMQYLSADIMRSLGYTVDANWSAHSPFFFNKHKMLTVLDECGADRMPVLCEVVYLSKHSSLAEGVFKHVDTAKLGEPASIDVIRVKCANKVLCNHFSAGFDGPMEQFLRELFPEPCQYEDGGVDPGAPKKYQSVRSQLNEIASYSPLKPVHRDAVAACVKPGMKTIEFGCGKSGNAFAANKGHVCVDVHEATTRLFMYGKQVPLVRGWFRTAPRGVYHVILLNTVEGVDRRQFCKMVNQYSGNGTKLFVAPDYTDGNVSIPELVMLLSKSGFVVVRNLDGMLEMNKVDGAELPEREVAVGKMFATVIVPCVGYVEYLKETLPRVVEEFTRVVVATSITDRDTIAYASSVVGLGNVIVTERWFAHGSPWNKGAGVSDVIKRFINTGWIAIMDADTIVPRGFGAVCQDTALDEGVLYSPYLRIIRGNQKVDLDDRSTWEGVRRHVRTHCGYFQLWHANHFKDKPQPWYPETHHIFGEDVAFKRMWHRTKTQCIVMDVLHIGSNIGVLWKSRRREWLKTGKPLFGELPGSTAGTVG